MTRLVSTLVLAIAVGSSTVHAQNARLVVGVPSADVRTGPSVVNPVVGHAPQGTMLEVTRDVGDWYKIVWPGAADRIGYVRRAELTRQGGGTRAALAPAASGDPSRTAFAAGAAARSPEQAAVLADLSVDRQPIALRPATHVNTPTHVIGGGASIGGPFTASAPGFGIGARIWSPIRLGLQVAASRHSLTSTASASRVTFMQLAPSVLYALPDQVSDYVWVRPFVGAGMHMNRSTFAAGGAAAAITDHAIGMQTFGGGELTLAGAPRLAMSIDLRYQWTPTAFAGFDAGGLGLSVGANWYFR